VEVIVLHELDRPRRSRPSTPLYHDIQRALSPSFSTSPNPEVRGGTHIIIDINPMRTLDVFDTRQRLRSHRNHPKCPPKFLDCPGGAEVGRTRDGLEEVGDFPCVVGGEDEQVGIAVDVVVAYRRRSGEGSTESGSVGD
jgi:hypothetical protein